jgi:hypothetical protein
MLLAFTAPRQRGSRRREEGVMKRRKTWAHLEGFEAVKSILDLDPFAAREIMLELDPEREDPLLNPWKRGYSVAMRTTRDH